MVVNRNKLKKISIIIASALGVILLAIFIFYKFFINEDYLVFKVSNITNLYDKVKKAEKDTGTLEMGEEDINSILQTYAKKLNGNRKIQVLGLYSKLENSNLDIYLPIKYGIIKTTLFCRGTISFEEDRIVYSPNIFKVGKIPLSKSFVINRIKKYSSEDININNNYIYISKNIIPFEVLSLDLKDEKITAQVQKVAQSETANANVPNTAAGGTVQKGNPQTKQDILKRASSQLNGVRNDVTSAEGKLLITKIQTVVNKMISDPNYAYQGEADAVKSEYAKLPTGDRDNIKEAILNNMDTTTMKQIRSTFGL